MQPCEKGSEGHGFSRADKACPSGVLTPEVARQRPTTQSGRSPHFFTKMDFGTMQWTPLRMSTICVTRQSPAIEVSA